MTTEYVGCDCDAPVIDGRCAECGKELTALDDWED